MATETQTQTGQCATHGTVQATRDIPKMGFPFILYAYLRSRAKRKPSATRAAAGSFCSWRRMISIATTKRFESEA